MKNNTVGAHTQEEIPQHVLQIAKKSLKDSLDYGEDLNVTEYGIKDMLKKVLQLLKTKKELAASEMLEALMANERLIQEVINNNGNYGRLDAVIQSIHEQTKKAINQATK